MFGGVTITNISYGAATLNIKQNCGVVVAPYDGRTCEVCAVYMHIKTKFTHFVAFISAGHMRDFESDYDELVRMWCSND